VRDQQGGDRARMFFMLYSFFERFFDDRLSSIKLHTLLAGLAGTLLTYFGGDRERSHCMCCIVLII